MELQTYLTNNGNYAVTEPAPDLKITYSPFSNKTKRNFSDSDDQYLYLLQVYNTDVTPDFLADFLVDDERLTPKQRLQIGNAYRALKQNVDSDWYTVLNKYTSDSGFDDDGVFSIEWTFPHFGLGFLFDDNQDRSGWFTASYKDGRSELKFGYFGEVASITDVFIKVIAENLSVL